MPELYFMMYLFGQISGVVGPLPYGDYDCAARVEQAKREVAAKWRVPIYVGDREVKIEDMDFRCERHAVRPELALK